MSTRKSQGGIQAVIKNFKDAGVVKDKSGVENTCISNIVESHFFDESNKNFFNGEKEFKKKWSWWMYYC